MPEKPLFDVCCIMLNAERTLDRLFASLVEFQQRGGNVVVVDTGSRDRSVEIARSYGAKVHEAGDRFMKTIDAETAEAINRRFVADGDEPIVKEGSRLFHFSEARNFCASLAENDWVSWIDSDEAFVRLDIDRINEYCRKDIGNLEYNFCYAWQVPPNRANPDDMGVPAVEFVQSKMYRRYRMHWVGAIHELVSPLPNPAPGGMGRECMPKDVLYLGHWQIPSDHRSCYLPGLGWDAWMKLSDDPNNSKDRQWHYLGREMMYWNRPRSAIKVLSEHIEMRGWPAERAQSMIFIGDCYGMLGDGEKQCEWYHRAFHLDSTRREALVKLSRHYTQVNNMHAAAAYAAAALEIPWHPFYANAVSMYRAEPYALRSHARGWIGNVGGAGEDLLQALRFEPYNEDFISRTKFYFEYDCSKAPEGWMEVPELLWLHDHAKQALRILEVGSWKGRSTHALCTGAVKSNGVVWAVDHFGGAADPRDLTYGANADTIYRQFSENLKGFDNLRVRRADSLIAAKQFPNNYFDLLFIDGTHLEKPVKQDILAWRSKVKAGGLLSGHDFSATWPGVCAAVRQTVGEPDGVCGSIWWKKMPGKAPNQLREYLRECIAGSLPVSFVKLGDGESACMAGAGGQNCDGQPYSPQLAEALRGAFDWMSARSMGSSRTIINIVPFQDQEPYNCLLHRHDNDVDAVKRFWGAIRDAQRPKLFVGPRRLKPAASMLVAEFVEIPETDAFRQYHGIRDVLRHIVQPGIIAVFCGGLAAKCWIRDVLEWEPTASCIDAGSAFDPLFVGQTRTEQLPMDFLLEHYGDWLG